METTTSPISGHIYLHYRLTFSETDYSSSQLLSGAGAKMIH